jgi:thioredoxin reductase (NADPH)
MQETDIIIVGAIGIEMGVALKCAGAEVIHVEAGCLASTFATHWPRHARFLSKPEDIAIAGVEIPSVDQGRLSVDAYIAYLRAVVRQFDLAIRLHEPVTNIDRGGDRFTITTRPLFGEQQYRCSRLILAVGDMHRRRRLEVPGSNLPHVRHGCLDPHDLFGYRVLVIGGRNSAVESAVRLHRIGCDVTLACRETELPLDRISHKIGPLLTELVELDRVRLLESRIPVAITPDHVTLAPTDEQWRATDGPHLDVPTDRVVIEIGFEADTSLLTGSGVSFDDAGSPIYDEQTMQAAPGVYLAGTASAAGEEGHEMFIETCHLHVDRIARAVTDSKGPRS